MIAAAMLRKGARADSGVTSRVYCALVSGRASRLTHRMPNLEMISSHAFVQPVAQPSRLYERCPLLLSQRWLSTASGPPPPKTEKASTDSESDETQLAPLTTAQKVQVGFNLTLWAAGIGLACACGYFIIRELMPTKMSPNRIFDTALEVVRRDDNIRRYYGEPLKGYGRDHGGHREGRRNFIENSAYEEKADGSKRVRVRFNVKGPYAEGFVFAEVSNNYDGWVYLMVQDKRTGRVFTIEDNRTTLLEQKKMRSDAERSALSNLLGGPSFDASRK